MPEAKLTKDVACVEGFEVGHIILAWSQVASFVALRVAST